LNRFENVSNKTIIPNFALIVSIYLFYRVIQPVFEARDQIRQPSQSKDNHSQMKHPGQKKNRCSNIIYKG